jgi:chorismate mutase / prephenate dehydratase
MSLDNLRKQIDELDDRIIKLIAERLAVTRHIGKEKTETGRPIEDKVREQAVLERVRSLARTEGLNPEEVEKIYQRIFSASKEVQSATVAFQGEVGAYSEEAAYQFFGTGARLKPCESLEEAFQTVEKGEVQYGLVPVENSLEGSIPRTYDLLLDSNLKVSGETKLRIIHCLIGLPDSKIDSIKEVYSHPQALGQCKTFLRQMGWKLTPTYDTAGSVKMIKENNLADKAAIAGARAAEIYGMKILVRSIEDNINNYTRFFALARQDAPFSGNDKTSIVFSVKHKPGALYDALKELAAEKINLTKIESRPTRQKPWEYYFYVDIEGHHDNAAVKEALRNLEDAAVFVKILGSYPKVK